MVSYRVGGIAEDFVVDSELSTDDKFECFKAKLTAMVESLMEVDDKEKMVGGKFFCLGLIDKRLENNANRFVFAMWNFWIHVLFR